MESDLYGLQRQVAEGANRSVVAGLEWCSVGELVSARRAHAQNEKCQGTDAAFLVRYGSLWLSACCKGVAHDKSGLYSRCCVRGGLLFTVTFAVSFSALGLGSIW